MEVREYLENVKKVFDKIDKTEVETVIHIYWKPTTTKK